MIAPYYLTKFTPIYCPYCKRVIFKGEGKSPEQKLYFDSLEDFEADSLNFHLCSSLFKEKYFHKGVGDNKSKVKVDKELSKLITFKQLNLLHDWPMKGPFDIIFCRNVIIYFDKETQQELFARYYEMLTPGGLLILGHSENLGPYQAHFDNVGRTIFRKSF